MQEGLHRLGVTLGLELAALMMKDEVAHTNGRMLAFVAFDPSRDKGLDIIKYAVALGAAGVKFYPPNGYRASSNDKPEIEKAADALFAYCAANGIPVFTHCNLQGFEAKIGKSGCNSDPKVLGRNAQETREAAVLFRPRRRRRMVA